MHKEMKYTLAMPAKTIFQNLEGQYNESLHRFNKKQCEPGFAENQFNFQTIHALIKY